MIIEMEFAVKKFELELIDIVVLAAVYFGFLVGAIIVNRFIG